MASLGIGFDSFFDETLDSLGQTGKHVYIVYTDDQGVEYVLEGGSYAPATGLIVARQGTLSRGDVPEAAVPNFGADDNFIYKPSVVETYVALDVADVEATWQVMQDHAQAIEEAEIPYVFSPGPNSNSFAASVLNAVGLNVQELLGVSIPGDITASNIQEKATAGEISLDHLGFIGLQNTLNEVEPADGPGATSEDTMVTEYSITAIIDEGVLGSDALVLTGLTETITKVGGVVSTHTVSYEGQAYNIAEVDPLSMFVTRDGEFTAEFTAELNALAPETAGLGYSQLVILVGNSNINAVLLHIAGSDGDYVL